MSKTEGGPGSLMVPKVPIVPEERKVYHVKLVKDNMDPLRNW